MDFVTMKIRLRRKIGNPTTDAVADALLAEYLNDAHRDIATQFHHHKSRKICTFDTVASTAEYGLPDNCGAVLLVKDITNDRKLTKLGPRRWANLSESTPDGQPINYVRLRNFVQLDPPPAGVYTIRLYYREDITDMSADGDLPIIPVPWHPGIILLARHMYYDDNGDFAKATYAWSKWQAWLSNRPTETEEESEDLDSGVELPTLGSVEPRLDFDHSE